MKTKRHLRRWDQSSWLRKTRDVLSSGTQKRYIGLILALVILAGYTKEFLDYQRKLPTPNMKKLNFQPQSDCGDPDQRVLSESDLEEAKQVGLKSTMVRAAA